MKLSGTITTHCTCNTEEMNDEDMPYTCYGECYDWALEDFANCVEPLFEDKYHGPDGYQFKIEGIRLWDRTVGGTVIVEDAAELIRAMSVNADYTLRWEFDDETLELGGRLSHHDGTGWVTVSPMVADSQPD